MTTLPLGRPELHGHGLVGECGAPFSSPRFGAIEVLVHRASLSNGSTNGRIYYVPYPHPLQTMACYYYRWEEGSRQPAIKQKPKAAQSEREKE